MDLVIISFALSIIFASYEFVGILKARIVNRTKNTGRVIIKFVVFVLLILLFWQYTSWNAYILTVEPLLIKDIKLSNTPYLICTFVMTLILVFTFVEAYGLFHARRKGLTKNISRFVSAAVILLCLIPILIKTMGMWDTYTEKLERGYDNYYEKNK